MTSAPATLDRPTAPADAPPPPHRRTRPVARAASTLRTALFWCHLVAGLAAGVVVVIMSATGVALAFQRQITEWAALRQPIAAPAAGAARLPLDTLVARAQAALPAGQRATAVTVRPQAGAPVTLGLDRRRTALVDPYTGQLLPGSPRLQSFFFEMERWHRSVAFGEGLRGKPGVTITGASNLAFLFLIASGFVLWWPRQLSSRAFRSVLLLRPRARGYARDWNWHHALGIWSAPVLFVLVATATFFSYQWPGALLTRVAGGAPPRAEGERAGGGGEQRGGGGERGPRGGAATPAATVSLDSLVAHAARLTPGWQQVQVRLPGAQSPALTATATTGPRPSQRAQFTVRPASGAITPAPGYATLPRAQRIRAWVRGLHTGEALGVGGQLVAALASAAAVVLAWTGIALAWRRFLRAVRRRSPATA